MRQRGGEKDATQGGDEAAYNGGENDGSKTYEENKEEDEKNETRHTRRM